MDRRMKRCALALVLLAAVMILPAIAGGTSAQTAFAAENVSVGLMEDGAFKAKDSMDLGTIDLSKLDPQGASGPIEFRLAIRYTTAIELSDFLKISFEFYGQSPVDNAFRLRSDVVSGSTTNKTAQAFIYFDPSGLTAGTYHGQLGAHLPFDEVTPNSSAYTFNSGILTIPISITLTGENPYLTPKVKKITAKAGNDRAEISWTPVDTCTNYSVFRREGTDENTSLPELDNYIYLGNVRTMSEGDGNGFSDPVYVDYYAQNGKTYSYIVISDGSSSPFSGDASRSVSVSPKASIRLKPAAPLASASSGGQDEIGLTWYWDAHGVQRDPATNEEDELTGNGQDQGEDLVDHFNVYSNGTLVRQVRRNAVKKLGSGYYNWQVSLPAEQEETEYTLWVTAVAPDGTEGYASNKVIAYTTKEWDLSIEGHTVRYIDEDGHSGLSIDIPATGVDRFEYWRKPVSADDSAYEKVTFTITSDGDEIDAGVTTGAVYTYKVIGYARDGRQTEPYVFNVATAGESYEFAPGGQPLEIHQLTSNGEDATIYWSAFLEGTYRLYRDGKLLNAWDGPAGQIRYTDVLAADGDYRYYVIWTNDQYQGLTVKSNVCSYHRFTGDVDPAELDQAPGAPRLVSRIDAYGDVQLQWSPSEKGGRPDGYVIFREDGGVRNTNMWHNTWVHPLQEEDADGRYLSRDANTTAYTDYPVWEDDGSDESTEDLSPHRYWITAYNDSGVSDPSEVVEYAADDGNAPATEDTAAPNAPRDVHASLDLKYSDMSDRIGKLRICWNAPKAGEAVSEYRIRVNDGARISGSCPAASFQYDVDLGTQYAVEYDIYSGDKMIGKPIKITVSAVNGAGETAAEPLELTVDGIPELTALASSASSAKLTWTGLIGDSDTEISEYRIWRRSSGSKWTMIHTAASDAERQYEDTGLTAGDTYEYCVGAVDSAGKAHKSKTVKVKPTVRDGNVSGPTDLSAQVSGSDVLLSWNMPEGGALPYEFRLSYQTVDSDPEEWYSEDLENASGDADCAALTEWTNPALWEDYGGETLRLKIYAVSQDGTRSGFSNTVEIPWPGSGAAGAAAWPQPVRPEAEAGDNRITLRWNKSGSGEEASYYQIAKINGAYYNPIYGTAYDAVYTVLASGSGTYQWTDRDVTNGQAYTYILLCCNSHHERDAYDRTYWYDPACEWNAVTVIPSGKTADQKIAENVAAQAEEVLAARPESLSDMTEAYRQQVEELRENYEGLTSYQKKLVGGDLCEAIEELLNDVYRQQTQEKYAEDPRVQAATDAIEDLRQLTLPVSADDPAYPAFAEGVENAEAAWSALPADARMLVENRQILTDAEDLIRQLQKAQADQEAADAYTAALLALELTPEDITEETLDDGMERTIADLRWDYDQLTKAQKALVSEEALQKLEELEAKVHEVQGSGHEHDMKRISAVKPTCADEGNIAYYWCESCGRYFLDAAGEKEVAYEEVILPVDKNAHDWDEGTVVKTPTRDETGLIEYICLLDPSHTKTEVIPRLAPGQTPVVEPADPPAPAKLAQPMTVKAVKKTVKAKKLKKKKQVVKPLTVKNAKGTVTYKVAGGTAKAKKALKLNAKTGKITVKKKTKKGTYKLKVKVTAAGDTMYNAGSRTVTVTVKVK